MTKKEFYKAVRTMTEERIAELNALSRERGTLLEQKPNFSAQYIREKLQPRVEFLEQRIKIICEQAADDAEKLANEFIEKTLYSMDSLNPADLNDDVKLLNCGVELTPRDLTDMLTRNSENRTMTQLILRYAKSAGVKLNAYYESAMSEADTLRRGVRKFVQVSVKAHDNPRIFDQMIGESSSFKESFDK